MNVCNSGGSTNMCNCVCSTYCPGGSMNVCNCVCSMYCPGGNIKRVLPRVS